MKPKILLFLALVLSGGLVGCSTNRQPAVIAPERLLRQTGLPVRFANHHQLYGFIAKHEGVQSFPDAVFRLAADSNTELYDFDDAPRHVWVVTPHFYTVYNSGSSDLIRGATGNGNFYLVRPLAGNSASRNTDCGFELVGTVEGNTYGFSGFNQTTRLTTHWHLSADKSPETVYEWNGHFFGQLVPDKSVSNR